MSRRVDPPQRYSAAVLGDGRILPIIETCGRRVLREIEPLSAEGRDLLASGHVRLWSEEFPPGESLRVDDMLSRLSSSVQRRRDTYPGLPAWTSHHDRMLKNIRRMQRTLKPRP